MQNPPTIDDPTFNLLLRQAEESLEGIPVRGVGEREGFIVSKQEYEQVERIKQEAGAHLTAMIEKRRSDTVHLSPEEQQRLADEMDDAILAEREKERHQRAQSP